jgi:hypothetical protein
MGPLTLTVRGPEGSEALRLLHFAAAQLPPDRDSAVAVGDGEVTRGQ